MNDRRHFLKTTAVAGIGLPLLHLDHDLMAMSTKSGASPICIFSKHLHWLNFEEVGMYAKNLGFEGIDLTVRKGGHVPPEQVEKLLPTAVKEITKSGIEVPMMATNIMDPDDPLTDKVLRVASGEGIKFYRMAYYKYNPQNEVIDDLNTFRVKVEKLAEMNEKYGIQGAYQNHAGNYVGASIWDIWYLMQGLDSRHIGMQFDIRHATVEGGQSWEIDFRLMKEYVKCSIIKDFMWEKNAEGQWKVKDTPVGAGMVDFVSYFNLYKAYGISGPISMHIEYPMFNGKEEEFTKKQKSAYAEKVLAHDLEATKRFMKEAGLDK